jgi:hypothetical protein
MNVRIVGVVKEWAIAAAVAMFAAFGASTVTAEPIQIVSGTASLNWDGDLTSFHLVADNSEFISEFRGAPLGGFQGGSTVNLGGTLPAANGGFHGLSQTVEGTLYQDVWLSGGLSILVAPFVAPHTSTNGSVTFQLPFTMTGQINGFANSNLTGPLFSASVAGGGTTAVTYRTFDNDTYALPHVGGQSFTFTAQPAATPEPASVLLVVTGLAGVLARHVRRRR